MTADPPQHDTGTPPPSAATAEPFAALGLAPVLTVTLATLGYEEPTAIQREAIPPLLAGRDLMGQAATGTGKTAAFALPLLQRTLLDRGRDRPRPSSLILVPTRELAMQVAEAVHRYGQRLGVGVVAVYGGHSFALQQRVLERGVDVVVATPGRALDHIRQGTLVLARLAVLVLDEADEMLDMGFADDLEAILGETPSERQTVMFSATLASHIAALAKRHMREPLRIQVAAEAGAHGSAPRVRQTAYVVPRARKLDALTRILDLEEPESTLLFCRTRTQVDELAGRLGAHGYRVQALHGGIAQDQRTRVVQRLRDGAIDLVVATDVAARGLDIENLAMVVNYDVPTTPESYVHRIGRVGRAGREGVAITLAEPRETRLIRLFERQMRTEIAVGRVPTIADLRARRLEATRVALEEALRSGDLEEYRLPVESLAEDHDPLRIAMAAVKLVHESSRGRHDDAPEQDTSDIPATGKAPARGRGGPASSGMGRIWIGAGRRAGIRPQDLVGAIAGESKIRGKDIGAIDIGDTFSVVELPEQLVDRVLEAMQDALIRGRLVPVRRFRER